MRTARAVVKKRPMNIVQAFGLVIRELRISKGWSMMKLGETAGGMSANQIGNIELAKHAPGLETISLLAQALDISLPELFRRVEVELSQSPRRNRKANNG